MNNRDMLIIAQIASFKAENDVEGIIITMWKLQLK